MRIPPNLKYFLFFILAIFLIAVATIYLPRFIPNIGQILVGIISITMVVLMFFVFIKPFLTFLFARADGIFEVYMDKNEKGFHIFTYHLNSDGEYGDSTRDIQHYFIVMESGKVYFNTLFSHSMTPSSGRSGWGDFYSFEESVLQNPELTRSLKKLSAKSNMDLGLGRIVKSFGKEDNYEILQDQYLISINKFSNAADEGFLIVCNNKSKEKIIWKRKI